MKLLRVLSIAGPVLLAGCAGSQSHLRLLESGGDVRVSAVAADDHDYVVSVRNTIDIGYNPDTKSTRDRVALQLLEAQCPTAVIVGEDVIATGTYLTGRQSRVYQIKVRCQK